MTLTSAQSVSVDWLTYVALLGFPEGTPSEPQDCWSVGLSVEQGRQLEPRCMRVRSKCGRAIVFRLTQEPILSSNGQL